MALPAECTGAAQVVDGHRSLALIVGVGDYEAVPKLRGPPNDAANIRRLLIEQYGFPASNVCTLVDKQASTAAFRQAFDRALVQRAQAGDVAVFFFAGHGSQVADVNGDEPDGMDETLLFQDARVKKVHDLVDDELNQLLGQLYARTENVVVLLDTCNSGSATRAAPDANTRVRTVSPERGPGQPTVPGRRPSWVPKELARAVLFTAATDGTEALEKDGRGVFTSALIQVLGGAGRPAPTYEAAARQLPSLIRAESSQVPGFEGDLDRQVFGTGRLTRPSAWEVKRAGSPLELSGPPMDGVGVGAEFRIYPVGLKAAEYTDPAKAKATVVIDRPPTGLNASARVVSSRPGAAAVQPGDFAVLLRPGDSVVRVRVRLVPQKKPGDGGLDATTLQRIRSLVEGDPRTRTFVEWSDDPGAELQLGRWGSKLVLRGDSSTIRNVFESESNIPGSLAQHARQKALLALRPEGGEDFVADKSLELTIVPWSNPQPCGRKAESEFVAVRPPSQQILPLCLEYRIHVKLAPSGRRPVLVGGVVLSGDGAILGLPRDGARLKLNPGEEADLGHLQATPPLDAVDIIRIFGTQESNPVRWDQLTEKAEAPARGASSTSLERALVRYLSPGVRGAAEMNDTADETTWTATTISTRVEANARFAQEPSTTAPTTREYTIPDFDIRPYLPDDTRTALRRVLDQAAALARKDVGYKQHAWAKSSDSENLKLGIDCSRAVWFAFTRAGLVYNRNSPSAARGAGDQRDYLATAGMVAPDTLMKDQFDTCSTASPQLGDILVYRDETQGDGHVVMVIDPSKRIAWGSHGWDGNAKEMKVKPLTGVQFQKIKYKPDWARWDRRGMALVRCWRYRGFATEIASGNGPGLAALTKETCSPTSCTHPVTPP